MSETIDCLLVGYYGNKLTNINEILSKRYPGNGKIERPLNSAIATLGTYLHKKKISFDYINSIEDEQDILIEKLKTKDIMSIGISTTYCDNIYQIIDVINLIKKYNKDIKIILGGPFIVRYIRAINSLDQTTFVRILQKIKTDFIIDSYFGEESLFNIIYSLKYSCAFNQIPNILYNDGNTFLRTQTIDDRFDLEENTVDWSLFANRVGKAVLVRTSISCPFSCSFCTYPINAGKYKYISVDAVERELNFVERIGTVKLIQFIDDTFNVPIIRFKDILKMMIANKYSFKWVSYIRCQFIDRETVELMKESGCEGVLLGIESGNNDVLKIMNKSVQVNSYKKALALFNEYNITSFAFFIFGFPGETFETVKETMDFIEETKPTCFDVQAWIFDPRTPISKEVEKYKIIGSFNKWSHNTMDYSTALALKNQAFSQIRNSIPMYTDVYTLTQMLNNGISPNQITEILKGFIYSNSAS